MDLVAALLLDLLLAGWVNQLGSPAFAARQQAAAQLRAVGPLAVPFLRRAARHPDPEVRRAAGFLLDDWRDTFRPTASVMPPWIDMLPDDYPDRQAVLDRHLVAARGAGYGTCGPDWPDYRLATVLLVDELAAAGRPRCQVRQLLDGMAGREQAWRINQRVLSYE